MIESYGTFFPNTIIAMENYYGGKRFIEHIVVCPELDFFSSLFDQDFDRTALCECFLPIISCF